MNKRVFSTNLFRILVIAALVISLALGTISPVNASSFDVVGWGQNIYGVLNIPTPLTGVVAISAGYSHSLALKSDGTVIAWGCQGDGGNRGQCDVPGEALSGVIAIAAGESHSLALKSDKTVVGWGYNYHGQTDIPTGLANVTAIAAGWQHSLALKEDGTVEGWGGNSSGQTTIPVGLDQVVAIAAGTTHSLALKSDKTVVGWGGNSAGQINIPSGLANVTAISAGAYHSLALKSDGTVVGWGYNNYGQTSIPDGLNDVVAIAAGRFHSLALKSDGTVVGWGYNANSQTNIPSGLTGVVAIAAGTFHNLALVNTPPVANPGGPYLGAVNTAIQFDGSGSSDANGDPLTYAWNFGDDETASEATPSHSYAAAGEYIVCLTVNDGTVDSIQACTLAEVSLPNTAPTANPGGPYLGAINTSIAFDGSGSSDADGDPLTYAWTLGDGGTATGAVPTHSYAAADVYDVCLTVNDGSLDSVPACTMAVVYDPSGGFASGGGWIESPAGAYKPDESLTGRANFGFQSKYQKGATVPEGNTGFRFQAGDFSFQSEAYEWLVVSRAATYAQFKGTGLINGALDPNGNAYKFMLWAGDGSPDTFRIRIWSEDAAGAEQDVYDNGFDQAIGAGNIVVHAGK